MERRCQNLRVQAAGRRPPLTVLDNGGGPLSVHTDHLDGVAGGWPRAEKNADDNRAREIDFRNISAAVLFPQRLPFVGGTNDDFARLCDLTIGAAGDGTERHRRLKQEC